MFLNIQEHTKAQQAVVLVFKTHLNRRGYILESHMSDYESQGVKLGSPVHKASGLARIIYIMALSIHYTPAKQSFRRVYCVPPVHPSVNISSFLLYIAFIRF